MYNSTTPPLSLVSISMGLLYVYKLYHQCFSVEYGFFFIYRGFIAQYNGHADLEMRRLTALE